MPTTRQLDQAAVSVPSPAPPSDDGTSESDPCALRHVTQAYSKLGPLWETLTQALPHVRLPDAEAAALSLPPHERATCLLYHRVIEIRDAQWVLRPYVPRFVSTWIARSPYGRSLDPSARTLLGEAAALATALDAYDAGWESRPTPAESEQGQSSPNLFEEATWLAQVSTAMQHPVITPLRSRISPIHSHAS